MAIPSVITFPVPNFVWEETFADDSSNNKNVPGAWRSFNWMIPKAILYDLTWKGSGYI